MPTLTIERPQLPRDMREALKRHILRERQRKKEEADANEADKQRRRAEKVANQFFILSHRSDRSDSRPKLYHHPKFNWKTQRKIFENWNNNWLN